MSNLDYPIAVLSNEKSKLDIWLPSIGKKERKNNLQDGISRALDILIKEKRKEEKEERKKKSYVQMQEGLKR